MSEFDLEAYARQKAELWADSPHDQYCEGLANGIEHGFNKGAELERERVLDLVMEEASKQTYKIGDAGVPVLTIRQVERIISKLRGEK